ncbi:XRE family transcriptional regulator [Flaviaesturariibacter amylovorans]|uniref:HTH cro/C1-type domain-containing protein n=1 Tax=Flaviaesturariibacter amylovorans TaxID=1084520 RepID=A0ABP8GJY7_9BACT
MTYFAQNLRHLRKRSAKTQEQLGHDIRLGRTTIANYEAGFSSPTDPEVLVRLAQVFGVSIDELLTRDLAHAFGGPPNGFPRPAVRASAPPATGTKERETAAPPATPVSMATVSCRDAAWYAAYRQDPAWLAALPQFSMPGLPPGSYRVFEVADDSMASRFRTGDRVICRAVAGPGAVLDGQPYLLLAAGRELLLRRVLNRIPATGCLQLIADAPGTGLLELRPAELLELWQVLYVLSSELAPPADQVISRIADLEQRLQALVQRGGTAGTPHS